MKWNIYGLYIRYKSASESSQKIISGSFWSIIGVVFSKALLLTAYIFVARILGKELYGQYGIIRSTVNMFIAFSGFALGLTTTRFISEWRENQKYRISGIITISYFVAIISGAVFSLIIFFFADFFADKTMNYPELAFELRLGSVALFFSAINGAQVGILQGFEEFKKIAIIDLTIGLLSFPLFYFSTLYFSLSGSVMSFVLIIVFQCGLNFMILRKVLTKNKIKLKINSLFSELPILWRFSIPAILSGLLVTPVKWYTDTMLIRGSGFSENGIFTALITFQIIIIMATSTMNAPFLAVLSAKKGNTSLEKINFLGSWAIGIFMVLPFIFFPELILPLLGREFLGNSDYELIFTVICLYTFIMLFKQGIARMMAVHNLQWFSFFSNALWGITLILSFTLLSQYGALGLAISYFIAYTVNILIVLPVYFKLKIIPKKLLISFESFLIWIAFFSLWGVYFFKAIFLYRIFLFGIYSILFSFFFYKLYKKSYDN